MSKKQLKLKLGQGFDRSLDRLSDDQLAVLDRLLNRPDVTLRPYRKEIPQGLSIDMYYGQIILKNDLTTISELYVNGTKFNVPDKTLNGLETLMSNDPTPNIQARPMPQRHARRGTRSRGQRGVNRVGHDVPLDELQAMAEKDLQGAKLTYDTFHQEMRSVFVGQGVTIQDIFSEMVTHRVPESEIAHFLTHDSAFKDHVISSLYNLTYEPVSPTYDFKPVRMEDESLAGQLISRLGVFEAEYDEDQGVVKIGDRYITNIPKVDHNGVFHSRDTAYIPYHIGYFAEGEGSRVERLRHIDPVANAMDAAVLQYTLTTGDVRFKPLLDVTRNLPDFDQHPYGQEILDTLKRKIVLDKSYLDTNSLLADHHKQAGSLGAVALTMLDDDAKGLIDPYGTSNGSNMGVIFYLTQDAQFNADGTLTKGTKDHSLVGDVMNQFNVAKDNFNRHQMSFNAFLTSTDVKPVKVAYSEFAMWNAEDAIVLTEHGANQFKERMETGDKVIDMHGNKSVSSLVIDPNMDPEIAKNERLEHAVAFAKLNPELDMIVSPVSVASRLNMGVVHEGLSGETQDLYLPNGDVVKDGITTMMYMSLPQTAEHKSKDYGRDQGSRKYSTLFRFALSSKVGDDLYRKALIDDETRQYNIDNAVTSFERMGVSFEDDNQLLVEGNVRFVADSPSTVNASDFTFKTPAVIRQALTQAIESGDGRSVNIDLGDMQVLSPLTEAPIKDSNGRNVLPIRVHDGGIPYRYTDVFKNIALGNEASLQQSYVQAISVDHNQLTRKDSILKHIDTATFKEGAKTEIIAPDPRIKLGDIRTSVDSDRVVGHRDPCIQSGNAVSFRNIGGNAPNLTHVNPLMINQVDGDFDSDTMGINSYQNLALSDDEKQEFFDKSSVYEQLNRYGEVFLSTGGSHFKAGLLANQLDGSNITFSDGKSNAELATIVEDLNAKIVDSPNSYGAYAVSFDNELSVIDSLGRLADDGIKGNRQDIERHFYNGYTQEEDRNVMKALIAKSEWTGLAGSITNNLIAGMSGSEFDPELTRSAMDVTYTMTQSVLQMKKNADKLSHIDNCISEMKQVMSGKYDVNQSRDILLSITDGLTPQETINTFVDQVNAKGNDPQHFGSGLFNNTDASTMKFAYASAHVFSNTLKNLEKSVRELSDDSLQR